MQPTNRRHLHHEALCAVDEHEFCPFQLCSSVHNHSTDDSDNSHGSDDHSLEHVYDDDGDLIVKRKHHQPFEIIYIG